MCLVDGKVNEENHFAWIVTEINNPGFTKSTMLSLIAFIIGVGALIAYMFFSLELYGELFNIENRYFIQFKSYTFFAAFLNLFIVLLFLIITITMVLLVKNKYKSLKIQLFTKIIFTIINIIALVIFKRIPIQGEKPIDIQQQFITKEVIACILVIIISFGLLILGNLIIRRNKRNWINFRILTIAYLSLVLFSFIIYLFSSVHQISIESFYGNINGIDNYLKIWNYLPTFIMEFIGTLIILFSSFYLKRGVLITAQKTKIYDELKLKSINMEL